MEELSEYREVLREGGLDKPGFVYEVKGNHDSFNVLSSDSDLFTNFSNVGKSSYNFVKEMPFGRYSFVAIDARFGPPLLVTSVAALPFPQRLLFI